MSSVTEADGKLSSISTHSDKEDDSDVDDDIKDIYFEPLINLPEIDVKTLEEGCVRLVMRREQTLSLCANHYVLPNMKLFPHKGCSKSWMWSTIADFSEADARPEVLAIRFKNEETWKAFADQFENAKCMMEDYQKKIQPKCSSTKKFSAPVKVTNDDEKLSEEVAKLNVDVKE